ncbi:MAG: hypothetical protein V1922_03800 [bacterium]
MLIEKRIRFVISTVSLTLLLLVSTFFFFDKAVFFLPLLILASYCATFFSLFEGIEKIEWYMLFLMPVLLSVAMYLFYFLFPVRWLTRIPFILIYGISMYAMLLSSNIFNVGVEKNLQLYRAGFSVNYFIQTMVFFLLGNVLASFHWGFLANTLVFSLLSGAMSLQLYWSIKLDMHIRKEVLNHAWLTALIVGEGSLLLSFLPLQESMFALVIAVLYYCVAGLTHLHLDERLFKHSVREYATILIVILVILFLSISW